MLERAKTYIAVSPFAHVISTVSFLFAITIADSIIEPLMKGDIFAGIGILGIAAMGGNILLAQIEAQENLKRYKKIKHLFQNNGWDEKIAQPFSNEWCNRNIVNVAAKDSGFGDKSKRYFANKGAK